MERVPLHKALESLAWLEGTWRTETPGSGKYPTIKDFSYYDEISFMSLGQPMFNYTAQSFSNSDLKKPMHRETGFLRVNPGTNQVTLILAHNFGLTTIECGEITDKTIHLNSTDITSIKEAKAPHVTQIRREFKFLNNCLEYVLYMATSNTTELTEHLRAKYVKASKEA
ncbi:peroxynitrite isomerase THAP4 [Monomorium pharaonis]|uniref:peroxynitrite isomerase THAP4 n=1 Tax=Monomorium pharaonis TaxID=307658 RepID=UPI00063F7B65|nr:peroxynitrite isomerase THAP4 [Monomorium pharaonis]